MKRISDLIFNGHSSDCPAPKLRCICEKHLYSITGALALIAGIAQLLVGMRFSMAVLSDSLHALADAGADFVGVFVSHKAGLNPHQEDEIRAMGNKIIAIFLLVGATIITYEASDRWGAGNKTWLPAAVGVGLFGLGVDLLRFRMLSNTYKHSAVSTLQALIEHARSDAWHSGIISGVAGLALLGNLFLTPSEQSAYQEMVGYGDCLASVVLAGYMAFKLMPKVWRGEGCCGEKNLPQHKDDCCGHDHHDHNAN